MSKHVPSRCPVMQPLRAAGRALARAGQWLVRLIHHDHVPIEVLIADDTRRRALKRELASGVRRLQRIFGAALPTDVVVVAQQLIAKDRQPAGCFQVGMRPDGSRYAVIRLALQANGKRLSTDEVLAALTEQCIGILAQDARSVVVPIEFDAGGDAGVPTELPGDPLAPVGSASPSDNNNH